MGQRGEGDRDVQTRPVTQKGCKSVWPQQYDNSESVVSVVFEVGTRVSGAEVAKQIGSQCERGRPAGARLNRNSLQQLMNHHTLLDRVFLN